MSYSTLTLTPATKLGRRAVLAFPDVNVAGPRILLAAAAAGAPSSLAAFPAAEPALADVDAGLKVFDVHRADGTKVCGALGRLSLFWPPLTSSLPRLPSSPSPLFPPPSPRNPTSPLRSPTSCALI